MKKKIIRSLFLFTLVATSFSNYTFLELNASENVDTTKGREILTKEWNYEVGNKYLKNEIVINASEVKKVIQDFETNGDPNWWNAPSLFEAVVTNDKQELQAEFDANNASKVETDETIIAYQEETERLMQQLDNTNDSRSVSNVMDELFENKNELQQYYEENNTVSEEKTANLTRAALVDSPNVRNWGKYGDILVRKNDNSSTRYFGHAGIADIDYNWYVESCPRGGCGGARFDGVQYRSNFDVLWSGQASSNWGEYMVRGASGSKYIQALSYAQSKVGLPYNGTWHTSGAGFYSSELVYFSWVSAGYDLTSGDNQMIHPFELIWDDDTYRIAGGL